MGRIAAIADEALRRSGALGVLPTPLEAIRAYAGVEAVEWPELRPEVLGLLWYEERAMYVNERQSPPRRAFTEAHELVHALCPWHRAVLRVDTAAELFAPARDAIEAEANAGAARLIFQGPSFAGRAAALPPCLATVHALAEAYGASAHATLHHYVQSHPGAVAMLVAGRFPRKDGSLPVWRRLESPAFRADPSAADAAGAGGLDGLDGLAPGSPLRELIEAARTSSAPPPVLLSA